jgi:hypothetical protein
LEHMLANRLSTRPDAKALLPGCSNIRTAAPALSSTVDMNIYMVQDLSEHPVGANGACFTTVCINLTQLLT